MEGSLDGEREERRRRFGYDVFTEAERMLVAGTEAAGGTNTLTIARGRFDAERVASAFLGATPGAVATQWRGSSLWEGQGRAVALVTPRTIAQGDGPRVRAPSTRRGAWWRTRAGARWASFAARWTRQESARGDHRDLGDRRHAGARGGDVLLAGRGCGGSARG